MMLRQPWDLWLALSFYIAGYSVYSHLLGLSFNDSVLSYNMQYLGVEWLASDLLRSLYYLHSQPPLMNLYLGVVFKLWPANAHSVFLVTYFIAGLMGISWLVLTMAKLGINQWVRFLFCATLCTLPTFYLYNNWIYTAHLEFCLCAAAIYALCGFCMEQDHRQRRLIMLFTACCLLGLMRAQWHLGVFIGLAILLCLRQHPSIRRMVLLSACICLMPLAAWYVKNGLLFGVWGASSWVGSNLGQITRHLISPQERQQMSEAKLIMPKPILFEPGVIIAYGIPPGIINPGAHASLQAYKRSNAFSFNYAGVIATGKRDLHDAAIIISYYPDRYLSFAGNKLWYSLWKPSMAYEVVGFSDMSAINGFGHYYQLPEHIKRIASAGSFMLYGAIPCALAVAALASGRLFGPGRRSFILYAFYLSTTMVLISCLLSEIEHERMRWGVAPAYLCLAALAVQFSIESLQRLLKLMRRA